MTRFAWPQLLPAPWHLLSRAQFSLWLNHSGSHKWRSEVPPGPNCPSADFTRTGSPVCSSLCAVRRRHLRLKGMWAQCSEKRSPGQRAQGHDQSSGLLMPPSESPPRPFKGVHPQLRGAQGGRGSRPPPQGSLGSSPLPSCPSGYILRSKEALLLSPTPPHAQDFLQTAGSGTPALLT